eukprot:scaffold2150_cov78-Skeletonema_menzelii.AAC.1
MQARSPVIHPSTYRHGVSDEQANTMAFAMMSILKKQVSYILIEQKMSIYYGREPSFRGYMPMGVENTEGKTDGREQMEYAAEYGKIHSSREKEHFYHRLRVAENPWPDTIQPSLRPAINDYVNGVLTIGDQLRDALCVGMGIDPTHLSDKMFRKKSGDEQEPKTRLL